MTALRDHGKIYQTFSYLMGIGLIGWFLWACYGPDKLGQHHDDTGGVSTYNNAQDVAQGVMDLTLPGGRTLSRVTCTGTMPDFICDATATDGVQAVVDITVSRDGNSLSVTP